MVSREDAYVRALFPWAELSRVGKNDGKVDASQTFYAANACALIRL
jgi:hypothetical protein